MSHTAYIAIGSNLGHRHATIAAAVEQLRAAAGIEDVTLSPLYETDPVGGPPGQPRYLNGAARLRTTLDPRALLNLLLDTEQSLGRVRRERWGPRTLDLDLLLFDDQIIDEPGLTVPHPRMTARPFVLQPLADLAPDARHPTTGLTITQLLHRARQP